MPKDNITHNNLEDEGNINPPEATDSYNKNAPPSDSIEASNLRNRSASGRQRRPSPKAIENMELNQRIPSSNVNT